MLEIKPYSNPTTHNILIDLWQEGKGWWQQ